MTEKRGPGRPRDPGLTVVTPEAVADWQSRPMFELVVEFGLPTANVFRSVTRRELFRLHRDAHTAIHDAFHKVNAPMASVHRRRGTGKNTKFQVTWRLPKEMVFPTRAILHPTIYRKDHHETDPQNYVFPLDKLIIDKLTEPKGNKWRGFGLLVDDSDRFLYLMRPDVEYKAPQEAIVMHFYAYRLPDLLTAPP